MTLSDLKWPFHASRAISVVAELLGFAGACGTGEDSVRTIVQPTIFLVALYNSYCV